MVDRTTIGTSGIFFPANHYLVLKKINILQQNQTCISKSKDAVTQKCIKSKPSTGKGQYGRFIQSFSFYSATKGQKASYSV